MQCSEDTRDMGDDFKNSNHSDFFARDDWSHSSSSQLFACTPEKIGTGDPPPESLN
jgi:hypothetical protein